jgi:hypothetical protein
MGCVSTIHFEGATFCFPKQSDWVGQRVRVFFHYDTNRRVWGTVVRDDREAPHEMLIALDDGPIVRSVECQHSMPETDDGNGFMYALGAAPPSQEAGTP